MNEYINDAKDELKRADHIIYVSLKYTRTVDVLKGAIQRLINAFDIGVYALLSTLKDEKKLDDIPTQPGKRVEILKKEYKDDDALLDYLEFYMILRKMNKADFQSFKEFRRHVMMTVVLDGKEVEVNIDIITEYFHKTKEFVDFIEKK